MKQSSHLDFQKSSQFLNALIHLVPQASLATVLTALGQVAYDTDNKRAKIFDGAAIRTLLQDNDIVNDGTLGGGSASTTKGPSQASVKAYVDALFASGFTFTDFSAASAQFPTGATASNRYRVSVAGTVLGQILEVGDVFYPRIATPSATNAADWVFVNSNVSEATASVLGLLKVAVIAELTGTVAGSGNKVVTVDVFKAYEAAVPRVRKYVTTINVAIGANAVTHSLGTSDVIVDLSDASGPLLADWTVTNVNTISISSAVALSNVKVIVLG